MSRIIILPIVALVMLFIQRIFNIQFSDTEMQTLTDGILSLMILLGILSDPKKKDK